MGLLGQSPHVRRWLTPSQLGEHLATTDPRVARLNRKRRREYAVRLVQRVEKLEEIRCLKRVGKRILVSWHALESLLPPSVTTMDLIDTSLSALNHEHRHLKQQMNGYGSQLRAHGTELRDHRERIAVLEEKEAARREFEAKIAAIESRTLAAASPRQTPAKPILKRARGSVQTPEGQGDSEL